MRKENENREEQKRKANQTSSGQRPTPWFLPQSRSLPSSPFHPGSGSKAYKTCRSSSIPCSSLGHKEQSRQVRRSVDLELERCRQQAGFPGSREKGLGKGVELSPGAHRTNPSDRLLPPGSHL